MKSTPYFIDGGPWGDTPPAESAKNSPQPADDSAESTNLLETIRNIAGFASILRIGGAITMIAAMSAFLMQGWANGNDVSRFYLLMIQTVLLAGGGLGLSYLLQENKGARVFFGLGLISITVNMTTLGALIFSTTQWGSSLVQYPGFAKWVAVDFGSIAMALAGTIIVSTPMAYLSHMVLARRSARLLSGLFLFTNLLLLLPIRESLPIGIVAVLAILVPIWFVTQRMMQDNTLRTPEGLFAIATLFIPAIIIVCRSLWLYPTDELLTIALGGIAFTALRFCAPQVDVTSFTRSVMNMFSIFAAATIALGSGSLIATYLPDVFANAFVSAIFAGLLMDISTRSTRPKAYARLAAAVLAIAHILTVSLESDPFAPIFCIAAGLAVIAIGRHYGLREIIVIGGITILAGLTQQIHDIMLLIDFGNWITLSITGASIIVFASFIERHGAVIKLKWDRLAQPTAANDDV